MNQATREDAALRKAVRFFLDNLLAAGPIQGENDDILVYGGQVKPLLWALEDAERAQ